MLDIVSEAQTTKPSTPFGENRKNHRKIGVVETDSTHYHYHHQKYSSFDSSSCSPIIPAENEIQFSFTKAKLKELNSREEQAYFDNTPKLNHIEPDLSSINNDTQTSKANNPTKAHSRSRMLKMVDPLETFVSVILKSIVKGER